MITQEELDCRYMDGPEAAKTLGISTARIRQLCLDGRFEGALKIGRSWIIPREAVLNHKPLPPGVKPRAERLREERATLKAALAKGKEER